MSEEHSKSLLSDTRPIVSICGPGEEGVWYTTDDHPYFQGVNKKQPTKITPYEEPGGLGPVVWFEVWSNDILVARVNSLHIELVKYA